MSQHFFFPIELRWSKKNENFGPLVAVMALQSRTCRLYELRLSRNIFLSFIRLRTGFRLLVQLKGRRTRRRKPTVTKSTFYNFQMKNQRAIDYQTPRVGWWNDHHQTPTKGRRGYLLLTNAVREENLHQCSMIRKDSSPPQPSNTWNPFFFSRWRHNAMKPEPTLLKSLDENIYLMNAMVAVVVQDTDTNTSITDWPTAMSLPSFHLENISTIWCAMKFNVVHNCTLSDVTLVTCVCSHT